MFEALTFSFGIFLGMVAQSFLAGKRILRFTLGALLFFSGIFLGIFFTSLSEYDSHYEANPIEYFIWRSEISETAEFNLKEIEKFELVCIFEPHDSFFNGVLEAAEDKNPNLKTFMKSNFIDKIQYNIVDDDFEAKHAWLGGIARAVWIDTNGMAEIWNFHDGRFSLGFKPQLEPGSCVPAKNMRVAVSELKRTSGDMSKGKKYQIDFITEQGLAQ